MSLERTRTRTIRPIFATEASGPIFKIAKPYQRLIANLFDLGLMAFIVLNTYKYFDMTTMLPKSVLRHHYFIVGAYFYLVLTVLPHHFFGQTVGQFVTGIKVVTMTFGRPTFFIILARDLLRPTTLFIPTPVLSKKSRAWYDGFLKTTIVDIR